MFDYVYTVLRRRDQVRALVQAIDDQARQLNGLPPAADRENVVAVLQSAHLLLERLAGQPRPAPPAAGPPPRPDGAGLSEAPSAARPPALSIAAQQAAPEPSATARELVQLRDWVLLSSQGNGDGAAAATFDRLYRRLGQLLGKEGLLSLEESGRFDEGRHQVVGTRPTGDPEQDDEIHSTVRPGYLFAGRLYRPQQVIVYEYDN